MLSRSLAALNRRRNDPESNEKGFTLIELLVVVIIIGVLAAIAIPVYLGVQNNAKDAAIKSDLTNAKIAVVAYQTDKGSFPTAVDTATLSTYGYTQSTGSTIAWGATGPTATTFCIDGSRAGSTAKFMITSTGAVETGPCS